MLSVLTRIHSVLSAGRSTHGGSALFSRASNAAAEAFNSLYKAELIRNRGPWAGVTDVEIGTAEYIDWFNHRRLHGEIGHLPPAEYETNYYAENPARSTELATTGCLH